MAYKQANNPISRKTSPLRDKGNHPHPHNKPGVISIESPETASTSVHPKGQPNPHPLVGQPMPDVPYEEISDMEEAGADQPDYEDPNWKPGMSRKSSPLNGKFSDAVKDKSLLKEKPATVESASKAVSDFETKVKKQAGSKKSKTAKDAGKVDKAGREGTNRQERKKRRKERKTIRKDKTLSRSQKTMAKKESREKQKENVRGVKK
mgnify:CR=1 FL=1